MELQPTMSRGTASDKCCTGQLVLAFPLNFAHTHSPLCICPNDAHRDTSHFFTRLYKEFCTRKNIIVHVCSRLPSNGVCHG